MSVYGRFINDKNIIGYWDIIQGYLKAFEDIINNNELMLIGNDYINNMLKILEKSEKKF